MKVLRRLAQVSSSSTAATSPPSPSSPSSPTPATTPPAPVVQPTSVNIRTLPGFNVNLFNVRPVMINVFNHIANKLNSYLITLSAGKVTFSIVFTNPSVSGSEYTNSMKNMLNLSKWLNGILTAQRASYTIDDLAKIFNDLKTTVNGYTFPESNMAQAKSELVNIAQDGLSQLGTAR